MPAQKLFNLTRGKRIALELLGPPFLGVMIFAVCAQVFWTSAPFKPLWLGGILFVLASLTTCIPSAIYTVMLELAFRHFKPCSWMTVASSTAIGLFLGGLMALFSCVVKWLSFYAVIISLFIDWHPPVALIVATALGFCATSLVSSLPLILTTIGLGVGFLLGLLIRFFSPKDIRP